MTTVISGRNMFSALENYSQISRVSAQSGLMSLNMNRLLKYSLKGKS